MLDARAATPVLATELRAAVPAVPAAPVSFAASAPDAVAPPPPASPDGPPEPTDRPEPNDRAEPDRRTVDAAAAPRTTPPAPEPIELVSAAPGR